MSIDLKIFYSVENIQIQNPYGKKLKKTHLFTIILVVSSFPVILMQLLYYHKNSMKNYLKYFLTTIKIKQINTACSSDFI